MWIDCVHLAGIDPRGDDAPVIDTSDVFREERVFAVQGDGANGAFDGVIVDLDATIGQEPAAMNRHCLSLTRPTSRDTIANAEACKPSHET